MERRSVPVPVHHHRLWCGIWLPRADLFRYDAELLANETDARFIGYGAMLMESFVAIMALVAASIIEPGLYFAMNTPPAGLGITMPNLHEMGGETRRSSWRS